LSARSSFNRRGELPTVYGAGAAKAAVLNQRSGVWLATATSLAFVIRFGYCVPKPYWLIVLGAVSRTGNPLDNRTTPDNCHPSITKFATRSRFAPNFFPLPTGSS